MAHPTDTLVKTSPAATAAARNASLRREGDGEAMRAYDGLDASGLDPLMAFLPDPSLFDDLPEDDDEAGTVLDDAGMSARGSSRLASLGTELNVVVIGASGGIGSALTTLLGRDPAVKRVYAFSRSNTTPMGARIVAGQVDLALESSIARAAAAAARSGPVHAVFVTTGRLDDGASEQHLPDWQTIDGAAMALAYQVNTIGPMLVAKHFLPFMAKTGKSVFAVLSEDIARLDEKHGPGWSAYRASKAALNDLIHSLALQLREEGSTTIAAGIYPGVVDTLLSKSLDPSVTDDDALAPDVAAEALLTTVDTLTPKRSGCVVAENGIATAC